jgi:hypothetical protein
MKKNKLKFLKLVVISALLLTSSCAINLNPFFDTPFIPLI